ncbi:hypothetical protein AF332_11680 [Sporosarcina globispora]|uniref:Integrase n=1 Tax=Sporosarcina globispora TaxID=1459 RepID=A0A0M0GBX4_SPOGL|nr:site-specific integrase [Sporosarcina globispora]KON87420.1 hypothetical protein AF332_11680 [Sporosarcina globispora]
MSNKIYNLDIKEKFLSTYENEQTQNTLKYVFYRSYSAEELLEKDLYDFTSDQIKKVIKNTNPHSLVTAKSTTRFITQYISWAIGEGLRSNLNPLKGLDDSFYEGLIDKTKKIHYSKEEFIDLLEKLPNAQDQAFLMLMFHGIIGNKFEELRELSYNDIDWNNNKITLRKRNNQIIEVDDVTMRYLENAHKQQVYFTYNEKNGEHSERELLPNEYIFKSLKSPRAKEGESVTQAVLYTRLTNIKKEFDLEYLTPNAVKQSGMIFMAVELYNGKRDKLEYEDFEKIGKKFDYSMLNNNGYQYYNTTLMKEFCNSKNSKELYDIEIEY